MNDHSGYSKRSLRDTVAGELSRLWDLIFTVPWEDIYEGIILAHGWENRLLEIKNLPKDLLLKEHWFTCNLKAHTIPAFTWIYSSSPVTKIIASSCPELTILLPQPSQFYDYEHVCHIWLYLLTLHAGIENSFSLCLWKANLLCPLECCHAECELISRLRLMSAIY